MKSIDKLIWRLISMSNELFDLFLFQNKNEKNSLAEIIVVFFYWSRISFIEFQKHENRIYSVLKRQSIEKPKMEDFMHVGKKNIEIV